MEVMSRPFLSDQELIEKILNGESVLFEQLISKYNSFLYKIARKYGFNHENARDVLQDTHLAAYCNLKQFKFKSTFKTWLSKILIHKCLYKLKYGYEKNKVCYFLKDGTINCNEICSEFENGEVVCLKKELQDALQKTIKKLPLIYNRVFILREEEGYSVAETAKLMNISESNVRVRLTRAKKMLQNKLEFLYPPLH